ncbi:hypothetical protein FOMG_17656 [Fusarium oxysporum f. sp. melonis 26406]|uniref:PiggyBac transposable element-derived protein domain-containing protein n=2 Tax=Fusarium oxysporum f. sp. melonis 26406 TaxID=1089452 RepID=W9ZAS6_FUSOX|nr:hypothetical protein FOMG_17656 [Fusarium oxysporum f. sp. melonis 26406]
MALSGSYGRGHRRAQPQEGLMPSVYRQVDRWSKHIQGTGDSMYVPGSDLTVDEAMVRFTGRSLETTTIPQKPTPTGYKVWVLRQSGYFVRWLWHVHGRGPCGLVPPPVLETGGVDELLVAEKDREGKGIPWGQMHCIPTKDGKFSWKDNALVLFLTTVFREGNQVIRSRRWPASSSAANRAAREVFGSELGKDLRVPLGIDEYSHHTNGVDTGDQLRSYNQ